MQNLTYLDIHGNKITDISPIANLQKLEWLDVSSNRFSDVSSLLNMTNLKTLKISGNSVSDADLENLSNTLAGCAIETEEAAQNQ